MGREVSAKKAPIFVFAVIGEAHVEALSLALHFLKFFSRTEILVVQGRSTIRAPHREVIEVEPPSSFSDHQASLWLKTKLPEILAQHGFGGRQFCYLDSDVIAVSPSVDDIFAHQQGPVAFAADHVKIDVFSHWAVRCGCKTFVCPHLREALLCDFGVDVRDPDWTMWNGGVFVADTRSGDFFAHWHRLTLATFTNPYWHTRDQATLAATSWSLGLQALTPLPRRFNHVLDCHWGLDDRERATARLDQLAVWPEFNLASEVAAGRVDFLHLINHGAGKRGWRHWDEVAQLLPDPPPERVAEPLAEPLKEIA